MCHVLHYSCNVNAAVADSLRCRMQCTLECPQRRQRRDRRRQRIPNLRRDRRWSCATTVEHAATVTMRIADAYVTRCRRPAVARCRDNVVLCRSYNGKLERRDGSHNITPIRLDSNKFAWE